METPSSEPRLEALKGELAECHELAQQRKELLRLLVEYTPAAMAVLDNDLRYLIASRSWYTQYQLDDESIIGRSHYEVFPEVPERWKLIHQRCLAGATESCEQDPFPRLDGRLDWIRWQVFPWRTRSDEIGGIVMFTEVITERKQLMDQLVAQDELLLRLSTPIVPVSDQVLAMPLIGAIDERRAEQLMAELLESITARNTRTAIIDVTGVPTMDTRAATTLTRVARAAQLLGTRVILSGIRPDAAQAMVSLGIELENIRIARDLQGAITMALGDV